MAQRLARKICPDCKEQEAVPAKMIQRARDMLKPIPEKFREGINPEKIEFWRGKGCPKCADLGYRGRIAAAEVIQVNATLRELINQGASVAALEKELPSQDFITLTQDCLLKALRGETTLEEVLRVSQN